MIVCIAGGRRFRPQQHHLDWLISEIANLEPSKIVTGGQTGADAFGKAVALHLGIKHEEMEADWDKYRRAAGPIRNERMAEASDVLIAFPGGTGTANMRSQMVKRNKEIIIWKDNENN